MTNPSDILQKILRRKTEEISTRSQQIPLNTLRQHAATMPPPRGFADALAHRWYAQQPAVIAEIKKASPSKGILRDPFDPVTIAQSYEQAGATCLSVLTDVDFFQGSDAYLQAVREVVDLPLLRKDFTIDAYQIYEARTLGADCILLIVAALNDTQLHDLAQLAAELSLDVLVEVHDAEELARAITLQPRLIGINNRNLRTFETHLETTLDLLDTLSADQLVVSESGIHTPVDVQRLLDAGVYAFLVGEAFMRADDPGVALQILFDYSKA